MTGISIEDGVQVSSKIKCQMNFIYFIPNNYIKLILFKAPSHLVIFYFKFLKKKKTMLIKLEKLDSVLFSV